MKYHSVGKVKKTGDGFPRQPTVVDCPAGPASNRGDPITLGNQAILTEFTDEEPRNGGSGVVVARNDRVLRPVLSPNDRPSSPRSGSQILAKLRNRNAGFRSNSFGRCHRRTVQSDQ